MHEDPTICALIEEAQSMNKGQKAIIGLQISELLCAKDKHPLRTAAGLLGIDRRNVGFAKSLRRKDPQGFADMQSGKASFNTLTEQHRQRGIGIGQGQLQRNLGHRTIDRIAPLAEQGMGAEEIGKQLRIKADRVRYLAKREHLTLADDAYKKNKTISSSRIIEQALIALSGAAMSVKLITIDKLDAKEIDGWMKVLNESLTTFKVLRQQLRNKREQA